MLGSLVQSPVGYSPVLDLTDLCLACSAVMSECYILRISRSPLPLALPFSSNRKHLSYDVCLEVRSEIIRTVLLLYCVLKLCTVINTIRWTVLTVLWSGFCHTGPILCVQIYLVIILNSESTTTTPTFSAFPHDRLSSNLVSSASRNVYPLIRVSLSGLCHPGWSAPSTSPSDGPLTSFPSMLPNFISHHCANVPKRGQFPLHHFLHKIRF